MTHLDSANRPLNERIGFCLTLVGLLLAIISIVLYIWTLGFSQATLRTVLSSAKSRKDLWQPHEWSRKGGAAPKTMPLLNPLRVETRDGFLKAIHHHPFPRHMPCCQQLV